MDRLSFHQKLKEMNALLASLPTELLAKILVLTDDPLTVARLTVASLAWSTGPLLPADHSDLWAALIDAHVTYASSSNVNNMSPRDWYLSAALHTQVLVALSLDAVAAASTADGTETMPPVDLVAPGVARIVIPDTARVVDLAHTRTAIHLRHSNHGISSVVRVLPATSGQPFRLCACCQHSSLNTVDEGVDPSSSLFLDRPQDTAAAHTRAVATDQEPSVYVRERAVRSETDWEWLQGRMARFAGTSSAATYKQPRDGKVRVTHMTSAGLAKWSATVDGGVYWTCVQQHHFDVRVPPIPGYKGEDGEGDITELVAISMSAVLVRSRTRGWAVVSSQLPPPSGPNQDCSTVYWRPEFRDMAAPVLPPGCTTASDSPVVLGITHGGSRLLECSITDPTATPVPCAWWTPDLASKWIPLRVTAGGGWGAAILAAPVWPVDGVWAESASAVRKGMVPYTLPVPTRHDDFGSGGSNSDEETSSN
ncbi:hypothetical protein BC828DRAFT_393167, partial [Blastocladiella britannica]